MENFEDESKKERQLDNLVNLVENHTRSERHLEQYSHIGNPDNKEHARKVQDIRENEIENLKEHIINSDETLEEQLRNLKDNYASSQGYINKNKDNMNKEQLQNLERRQEHRKEQIENLEDYN